MNVLKKICLKKTCSLTKKIKKHITENSPLIQLFTQELNNTDCIALSFSNFELRHWNRNFWSIYTGLKEKPDVLTSWKLLLEGQRVKRRMRIISLLHRTSGNFGPYKLFIRLGGLVINKFYDNGLYSNKTHWSRRACRTCWTSVRPHRAPILPTEAGMWSGAYSWLCRSHSPLTSAGNTCPVSAWAPSMVWSRHLRKRRWSH